MCNELSCEWKNALCGTRDNVVRRGPYPMVLGGDGQALLSPQPGLVRHSLAGCAPEDEAGPFERSNRDSPF